MEPSCGHVLQWTWTYGLRIGSLRENKNAINSKGSLGLVYAGIHTVEAPCNLFTSVEAPSSVVTWARSQAWNKNLWQTRIAAPGSHGRSLCPACLYQCSKANSLYQQAKSHLTTMWGVTHDANDASYTGGKTSHGRNQTSLLRSSSGAYQRTSHPWLRPVSQAWCD